VSGVGARRSHEDGAASRGGTRGTRIRSPLISRRSRGPDAGSAPRALRRPPRAARRAHGKRSPRPAWCPAQWPAGATCAARQLHWATQADYWAPRRRGVCVCVRLPFQSFSRGRHALRSKRVRRVRACNASKVQGTFRACLTTNSEALLCALRALWGRHARGRGAHSCAGSSRGAAGGLAVLQRGHVVLGLVLRAGN
jgi:hypothetical protein